MGDSPVPLRAARSHLPGTGRSARTHPRPSRGSPGPPREPRPRHSSACSPPLDEGARRKLRPTKRTGFADLLRYKLIIEPNESFAISKPQAHGIRGWWGFVRVLAALRQWRFAHGSATGRAGSCLGSVTARCRSVAVERRAAGGESPANGPQPTLAVRWWAGRCHAGADRAWVGMDRVLFAAVWQAPEPRDCAASAASLDARDGIRWHLRGPPDEQNQ